MTMQNVKINLDARDLLTFCKSFSNIRNASSLAVLFMKKIKVSERSEHQNFSF
jgi:hypothetical protein